MISNSTHLSIIICTFNRSQLLKKCITSLISQETNQDRRHELIVVDNNSTDDTSKVVMQFSRNHKHIFYIHEKKQGLSYARNRGAEIARGEYLAYLDDDSIAPTGYLNSLFRVLDEYHPDIMGGPIFPYYDSTKPRWFKDKFEIRKFADHSGFSSTCRVSGGNFIIRRELLFQLGCFDINLGMRGNQIGLGEERALLEEYRRRIPIEHQRVYYSLECTILHYVPQYKMRRSYMMKRYYQVGRVAARIKNKDPSSFFKRMFIFFPNLSSMVCENIKKDGILKADYFSVLIEGSLRIGTMIELISNGWGPIIKPHIRFFLKKFRFFKKWGRR